MVEQPIGPGTLLAGRFRLEDLLDENDGARFWRATDRILARNVAVHVIPRADRRSDALLVAARTSATVSDGHLLRVLDAAEEDGVTYVVNEWGHGMSLDRILADGPLSARRAAWVVKEVAEAITTAHRSGIAHGRLVPENVMVTEAGSVKLIGFVVDAVLRGRDALRGPDGSPLDEHEADVLNLAALLYACLTGRWPGTGGSTVAAAPTEHGRPLRPRQVRAGVPRPLDAVCDRVLNPGSHGHAPAIESAHEIYAALADFVGDANGAAVGYTAGTLLDEEHHEAAVHEAGPPTQLNPVARHDDPAPTQEGAAPAGAADQRPADPEPTQAGMPVFYDEGTGVGWTTGSSRGLRSDEDDPLARRTPPPPPPPFPEPEPRPLFAPDPPAGSPRRGVREPEHTAVQAGPRRSTGVGAGPLPSSWGPDASTPPGGDRGGDSGEWGTNSWESQHPGTNWLRLAAVVGGLIVLVVALVFAFNLGKGSDTPSEASPSTGASAASGGSSPAASGPVRIASVSDFDPESSSGQENPQLAPLAIDGNPGTAWQTMTYYGRPDLGGLKSGVGLLLDLGKPTDVSKVTVTLQGTPTSLSLLAAPPGSGRPTSVNGLTKVDSVDGAGTTATLQAAKPVKTQYLVVWLTSLPAASGGYQGRVAEISVRS
ncbi:MAG: protein kinase family protein [Nocardioidaceae bacterium]